MSAFKQWLIEISYQEVQPWIYQLARQFHNQYGGAEFNDLLAQANYLFVKHLEAYDPDRSSLPYYLSKKIWHGLLDYRKQEWRRFKKHPIQRLEDLPNYSPSYHSSHFMTELMDSISEDAKQIVKLVLDPPDPLVMCLLSKQGYRVERRAIRQFLESKLKWSSDRVYDAFWSLQCQL